MPKKWKRRFKRSLLLIGAIVAFVLGWYAVMRVRGKYNPVSVYTVDGGAARKGAAVDSTLKLAAYNIAHGRGGKLGAGNWQDRTKPEYLKHLDRIAEQINAENPDVLVLNEVDFDAAWSFHVNQARHIAERCGYRFVLEQNNVDVSFPFYRFRFGNAVLSRFPIRRHEFLDFPPLSKWEDVFAGNHDGVYCEIETPRGPVGLFAVHLEHRSESFRLRCARKIGERASRGGSAVLAMGDFNSIPTGDAMTYLLGEGGFVAYVGSPVAPRDYTFPSQRPERVIDWIIARGARRFSRAHTVYSGLSDHLMVVSELAIE